MIHITPLNVTSIKVIEHELNETVQNASRHFEAFMGDRSQVEQLQESKACLEQIIGILKMLEMPGASSLANAMLELLQQTIDDPEKSSDFALSALSQSFVAMPCYIEYVVDRSQAMPALTLQFVNELRSASRQALIRESELADYKAPDDIKMVDDNAPKDPELESLYKRQRQMYQVGLIGLLREENLELKMQLMHRAMSRLASAVGSDEVRTQWLLGQAVLEAMLCHDLSLGFTRKRTLSQLDAEIRKASEDISGGAITASSELLTELVFLVNLSRCSHPACKEVTENLDLKPLPISDKTIQEEKAVMQGPNAETIITMVKALREELAQSKEILEVGAQDTSNIGEFASLVTLFQRSADILAVVGLQSPSQLLTTMSHKIQAYIDGENYEREQLLEIADGVLYVESALASLSRLDLNFKEKEQDDEAKRKLMAKNQLDEAQAIVLSEAQSGIVQAKKDINSFIESNFDTVHIGNVVEILNSVKGGVAVLGLKKAEAVISSCIRFVQATIDQGVDENKAQNILETMADALIALEYYLSEIELHGDAHPSVLEVAEQSLATLGYPVE